MKNTVKKIMLFVAISIMIINLPVQGFAQVKNQAIGRINGVEYPGDPMFWKSIESSKISIAEDLYKEFGDEGKSKYLKELKAKFEEYVAYELDTWIKLNVMIEDGFLKEEAIKMVKKPDLRDFVDKEYDKFKEERSAVSDEELIRYKEANPEKLEEYDYKLWRLDNLQEAENYRQIVGEKSILERILEVSKDNSKKENLVDEFKYTGLLEEIGARGGFHYNDSYGPFSLARLENDSFLEEDEIKMRPMMEELKKLKPGELSPVFKIEEDSNEYYLLLLTEKGKLADKDLKEFLGNKKFTDYEEKLFNNLEIQIIYPDFKDDLKRFDEYKKGKTDILVGKVDGQEVYLRRNLMEEMNSHRGDESEESFEKRKKYIQEQAILDHLKMEDSIKRELFTEEELGDIDFSWEYRERYLEGIQVSEKDLVDYKRDRELNKYKVFGFSIIGEDSKEESRKLLEKDDNMMRIAKIFSKIYEGDDYGLSEEEEKFLAGFKFPDITPYRPEEFTNTQFDMNLIDGDVFFTDEKYKYFLDKEPGEVIKEEDGIFDFIILVDKQEVDQLDPLIVREIKLYKYDQHMKQLMEDRK